MKARLQSIDLARGLVMMLMALDHVRDYFSAAHFDPTDLQRTNSALFVTRWVTHFCAPTFVFLAGVSAGITRDRGKTRVELARFLLSRGLWLVLLEVTLVHLAWTFDPGYHFLGLQVIWVLGLSMVLLAALQFLPRPVLAAIAIVFIAGHNLLDAVESRSPLWTFLHRMGPLAKVDDHTVFLVYPLVPWFAVMALGFCVAPVFAWDGQRRRRALLLAGGAALLLFTALRGSNLYGDPQPFALQSDPAFSLWSFLNTQKYPPSLLYLCMTLGPLALLLAALDRVQVADGNPFLVFGRVPLFFYLLHIPLIHGATVVTARALDIPLPSHFLDESRFGFDLTVVYAIWIAALLLLYLPCRWYARTKARSQNPWLSYL